MYIYIHYSGEANEQKTKNETETDCFTWDTGVYLSKVDTMGP